MELRAKSKTWNPKQIPRKSCFCSEINLNSIAHTVAQSFEKRYLYKSCCTPGASCCVALLCYACVVISTESRPGVSPCPGHLTFIQPIHLGASWEKGELYQFYLDQPISWRDGKPGLEEVKTFLCGSTHGWRPHMLHLFDFSPLCSFACLLNMSAREYAKLHRLHLFGFSPLCGFKSVLKWPAGEDAKSHSLHLFNLSPLCVTKWVLNMSVWEDA